ncbi:DUF2802 domain-containing protein [Paraneptunicella aestuarii]|uniref:DUF2802 domain-containing protein n=1 Tax=Paraneptunicella aestuarii TaxID=2831148 RepID=UPI001E5C9CC0|nr:DUF2802 domain-containing protein [Paraneptunicella aestuarii]UAA38144.1 DUF2802 domain-containing protein [Paraneptunicella aestuarii]
MQYISLLVAGIAIILAVFFYLRGEQNRQQLQQKLQQLEQRQPSIEKGYNQLQDMLHEIRTGMLGLGNRVKELEASIRTLENKQTEIANRQVEFEHQEASSPLYTKANKLVAAGASIEEIMQECDIPRAEAELLISLHKK